MKKFKDANKGTNSLRTFINERPRMGNNEEGFVINFNKNWLTQSKECVKTYLHNKQKRENRNKDKDLENTEINRRLNVKQIKDYMPNQKEKMKKHLTLEHKLVNDFIPTSNYSKGNPMDLNNTSPFKNNNNSNQTNDKSNKKKVRMKEEHIPLNMTTMKERQDSNKNPNINNHNKVIK